MTLRRVGRWTLGIALAVVSLSAVIGLAFVLLAHTERGRSIALSRIEAFVSANIPGKLRIGRIEQLGLAKVVATDVRFFHPDGTVVLLAKHAEVVPDIAMAVRGRLGFKRAAVDGGFLLLNVDPDGRLGLEATMNAPRKRGEPAGPSGGLHYWLHSMHTQHFTTTLLFSGQTIRLLDTSGFVGVRRIETQGVQVVIEGVSGRLEEKIAGSHVELSLVNGWVHGKEQHVAHFDANARIGSGKLALTLDYFDRSKTPVMLRLHNSQGLEATTMKWLLHFAGAFTDSIDVEG